MPTEDRPGVQLAQWQEALKKAQRENDTTKIAELKSNITKLHEQNQAEWERISYDAAIITSIAKAITNMKNLEQIQKRISELDTDTDATKTELEAHQLALQIVQRREDESQKIDAQKLLTEKEDLFEPLLVDSYRSTIDGTHPKYVVSDEARRAGLEHLLNMVRSPKYTTKLEDLEELKDAVFSLINSKSMKKFAGRNDHMYFSEAKDFRERLQKVKSNLNARLYPTYGAQIDELENYALELRAEGVTDTDTRKIKTVIFKSDRTQKLNKTETLIKRLIQAENNKATPISLTDIDLLIDQNKKATGSSLLHGKGKLHKILSDLRNKIANPIFFLTPAQFSTALSATFSQTSTHTFKNEIRRLHDYQDKLSRNAIGIPGGHTYLWTTERESSKVGKQLMALLVPTKEPTLENRAALEPQIDTMLQNKKISKELKGILTDVKKRIAIRGPAEGSEPPKPA